MKLLAIAALVLSSTMAFAYPALNDQAIYTGVYSQGPNQVQFQMELSLTQYDASNKSFLQHQVITYGTQTQVTDQWMEESQMLNPASVAQIISTCTSHGGKLESVVVGSKTLNACAVPVVNENEDSIYWIADVPFGIAKAQMNNKKDSSQTNLVMQSHK